MKWGLIGFGRWGKILSYAISKNYHLKAVSSRNVDRVRSDIKEKSLGYKAMSSEQIFEDSEIEVVAVTVPIESLFFYAKESIEKGKHVFLEKPGPKSKEQLVILKDAAKRNNVVCYTNYIYSEDLALKFLVEKIASSSIKSIFISWDKWGTFNNDIIDNLVTHQLSVLLRIIKKPLSLIDVQIEKNKFFASYETKNTRISLEINRISKMNKGMQMKIITEDSIYNWSPGKVTCMKKNIFTDESDMLVNQTKRMNSMVESMSLDSNFSLVEKVNNLVLNIRSFSK